MGILDFGLWGFWILAFGILDFGDFGFWILAFGILGIWDFGFWLFGILGILDFGDFGFWGGPSNVPLGNLVTVPGGQRLGSALVWATSKPTVSDRVGARKQIGHFFRGQNPTKSQKNPDFQPRGQNFTQSQKNLEFQPTSKQI